MQWTSNLITERTWTWSQQTGKKKPVNTTGQHQIKIKAGYISSEIRGSQLGLLRRFATLCAVGFLYRLFTTDNKTVHFKQTFYHGKQDLKKHRRSPFRLDWRTFYVTFLYFD